MTRKSHLELLLARAKKSRVEYKPKHSMIIQIILVIIPDENSEWIRSSPRNIFARTETRRGRRSNAMRSNLAYRWNRRAGRGIQWYATVDDDMPPNYRYPHGPTLDRGCATSYSTGYSTLRREMNTGGELCSFRDAKKMKSESISRWPTRIAIFIIQNRRQDSIGSILRI